MVTRAPERVGPEGQGQLDGQPPAKAIWGSAGRVASLPSSVWECPESSPGTHASQGAGGSVLIPWAEDVTALTDKMPISALPRQPLCLCFPEVRQRLLTSGQRPVMRTKGHQTTCPERQALEKRDGGGTGLPREATPWGYLIPPGGMPALELFLSPFTATPPRMSEKSYYAKH